MKRFVFNSNLASLMEQYLERRSAEGYISPHCGYYLQELDLLSVKTGNMIFCDKLIRYLKKYTAQLPENREWFFPSPFGHYSRGTIYQNFRELLLLSNIPHTGKGPRIHDFRHTFAVHTLEKQLADGYDPMVIVPRLAAYLGHKNYSDTC